MVVKSLELGQYSGLEIDPKAIEVDKELVTEQIKMMIHDKLAEMGLRQQDPDAMIVVDDTAVANLGIKDVKTVEDLEDLLSRQLYQEGLINAIMRQVLDNVTISYDEEGVEEELNLMMVDVEGQAKEQGFTLEFFCDYNGLESVEALKALYRNEIKTSYLEVSALEAIADLEGITVADDLMVKSIKAYEEVSGQAVEDRAAYGKSLLIQETVNWLVINNA